MDLNYREKYIGLRKFQNPCIPIYKWVRDVWVFVPVDRRKGLTMEGWTAVQYVFRWGKTLVVMEGRGGFVGEHVEKRMGTARLLRRERSEWAPAGMITCLIRLGGGKNSSSCIMSAYHLLSRALPGKRDRRVIMLRRKIKKMVGHPRKWKWLTRDQQIKGRD